MKKTAFFAALLSMATTGMRAQQKQAGGDIARNGEVNVRTEVTFAPVMPIKLGTGATNRNSEGTDVIGLDLRTVRDYTEEVWKIGRGKYNSVHKQLEVFSVGSQYTVCASLRVSDDNIYKILWLGLGATEYFTVYPASPDMKDLFKGDPGGFTELDASYSTSTVTKDNAWIFNELIGKDGKPKTHTADITYTIAPI